MLVRTAVAGLLLVLVLLLLATLRADTAHAAAGMPITVDKAADQLDTSPGDGECRTFGGGCSLRAAIMEANAAFGPDTIVIEPGVYELEIPTVNDNLDATGDFDVHQLARPLALIAVGRLGRRQPRQLAEPDPPQPARHRRERHR